MKKNLRITLSIIIDLIIVGSFATTCYFAYQSNWLLPAFWWTWIVLIWITNIAVGCFIFYKPNRTDELKTFWLFIMVFLPMVGAVIALMFNIKIKNLYDNPNNDHAKLQSIIFQSQSSIKIYTNSLFISQDTFKALSFASWKGIDICIIISTQSKKYKQDVLIYNIQKYLEHRIKVYFTNKQINESFVISDNKYLIVSKENFNFKNIYQSDNIVVSNNIDSLMNIWNHDLERSSLCPLEKTKMNPFKKLKVKITNIFYPFF